LDDIERAPWAKAATDLAISQAEKTFLTRFQVEF
jgi:hypothetical protein